MAHGARHERTDLDVVDVGPSSLPACLTATAWCKDGTIMAVRHPRRPPFGVQFHPESIGTARGPALCHSFLRGDHA
ncbi:MAG: gamma-glutamyl-gamma-aminobutyrate hydrolase family protein [Labilithrix sp.]|nr:gamma-glutamyl-gamma-aminobutyrate hydrolase family protein [Labilithrix sp.]MBX3218228.1 gamma-glutamyl-gamma-aminobutyrate hydrolase family protein [Labilithrix sp.]